MNLNLDDPDLETIAIVSAGVSSLDAGLSAAIDVILLSDLLGGSLGTRLTAADTTGGVVITDKFGLVEVSES